MSQRIQSIGVLVLTAVTAGFVLAQAGTDVLARLGLDKASAGTRVLESLTSGYVYDGTAIKAFKALPPDARSGVVRAGLAWAKDYAGSAEFKAAYEKFRLSRKPEPPERAPGAEETMAKMKADIQKGIDNLRQAQATADAEMKKTFADTIKQMQAQLEDLDKNPQMMENFRLGAEMQTKANQEEHQARMKAWAEDLPEEPRALVAKRIRQFLEASADVDYGAELTARGNKKIFVKEAYEKKPAYWKLCFRAGREATEAARAFAQAWLGELGKS